MAETIEGLDQGNFHRRIKRLLVERLLIDGINPDDIGDDAPIREEFGLDSVDALELVLGLEQEFGVQIVSKGIARESFQSVNTLVELVRGRLFDSEQEDETN
jgi:acyl carrier protein